ncbi:MAG TPA: hypothetical protein VGK67_29525 [Myxococcales bacterium]|jgi:hypothetical protein
MPSRLSHLALLALTASLAAVAGGACFAPVLTAQAKDAGHERPDGGDAGPSNLDGSCPMCLPSCEPTCPPGESCPFTTGAAFESGCAPASYSLTVAVTPDSGMELAASLCACGEAWAGAGTPADWGDNAVFFSACARTVSRVGPNGERMILVNEPSGTVRLFEQRTNGSWRPEDPPQIRAPATLAIDSAGNPHLAGLGQGAILHLARVDGTWIVDPAANADSDRRGLVLLALGPDGLPRIAFSEGDVKLATKTDAGWEHSTASGMGAPLSLQVDAEGRAHLLYLLDGVRYTLQTPGGWVSEMLDGKATAAALVLTAEGCPRAVWSRDGVFYGERTAAGWTSERIADGNFGVEDEPFVLLPDGKPLVLHGGAAMSLSGR